MKALILSAGLGERLYPLSTIFAKPAIPFHNKPLINRIIENLIEQGIKEIAVNLHYLPETIKQAVNDFKNIKIVFSYENKLLGTAGAIRKLENFLKNENFFLVLNGDTLQKIPVNFLLDYHLRENSFATLLVRKKSKQQKYSSLLIDEENNVIQIKPINEDSNSFMYCGALIFSSEVLNIIPKDTYSDIFKNIFPILKEKNKKIKAFYYDGPWAEIGTPANYLNYSLDYLPSDKSLVDENVYIHSSAKIERSIIGKNSSINKRVKIKNSIIWQNSRIDSFSLVENSIITNGLHLPASSIIKNKIVLQGNKGIKLITLE